LGLLGWDSLTGEPLDPIGVGLVLVAGACWVAYILASKKAGSLFSGQDGLAVALAIGGIALLPIGGQGAVVLVSDSHLLLLAFGTGLLASLIPYSLEITALRSLNPNVFSILVALEPVFAAFFGWLLLSQNLSPLKLLAIALVIMASVLQTMVPARGTKPKLRRVPWKARRRSRAKVG
ncbi:EamA family transporter, partial [Corynebacterium striatum]